MGFLLLSKGCIPGPHDFASVSGLAHNLGAEFTLVSPLSPTLRAFSHSGCPGPHEFTLVSPLSPLWVPSAA